MSVNYTQSFLTTAEEIWYENGRKLRDWNQKERNHLTFAKITLNLYWISIQELWNNFVKLFACNFLRLIWIFRVTKFDCLATITYSFDEYDWEWVASTYFDGNSLNSTSKFFIECSLRKGFPETSRKSIMRTVITVPENSFFLDF